MQELILPSLQNTDVQNLNAGICESNKGLFSTMVAAQYIAPCKQTHHRHQVSTKTERSTGNSAKLHINLKFYFL